MSELNCPRTGEACRFYDYCASRKEALEHGMGVSQWEQIATLLPKPLLEAMDASFCSDETVEALLHIEFPEETPDIIKKAGSATAAQMAMDHLVARNGFPTNSK